MISPITVADETGYVPDERENIEEHACEALNTKSAIPHKNSNATLRMTCDV